MEEKTKLYKHLLASSEKSDLRSCKACHSLHLRTCSSQTIYFKADKKKLEALSSICHITVTIMQKTGYLFTWNS